MEEYLDKNRALFQLQEALPTLISKADCAALREGIDEAREAGAGVAELKPYILALQKAAPEIVTETDEAILSAVDQVAEASAPQPAKPPPDSYLTAEQFADLLAASKSTMDSFTGESYSCPDDLKSPFGFPMIFFSLLRNPRVDPTPVVWEAVRNQWPSLQGVPDDELLKNLVECRKEYADVRAMEKEKR